VGSRHSIEGKLSRAGGRREKEKGIENLSESLESVSELKPACANMNLAHTSRSLGEKKSTSRGRGEIADMEKETGLN